MTRLQRNIVANYAGQGWAAAMALVFIPAYIRYIGVEAYGLIGLFAIVQAWLVLLDMGFTPTLSREMARFSAGAHTAGSITDLLRTLELLCVGIAAVVALSLWASSGYLASGWLNVERLPADVVSYALSVMALVVALRFVEGIYRASLIGLQKQVRYNVISAVLATVQHGGALAILAWISPSIIAFFIWHAVTSVLALAVFRTAVNRALPGEVRPRFRIAALADTWKFAGSMAGLTLLSLLLTQIDKVLLSRSVTLEEFAYYTLAATIAAVLYRILTPLGQAVYPRLVELSTQNDQPVLTSVYHVSAQLVTAATAPTAMVLAVFASGAVFAWSGDALLTSRVAPILAVLVLGNFLHGLAQIPYHLQLANGWVSLAIVVNICAVALLLPVLLVVVPRYGVTGAAWVWAAVGACYALGTAYFMHRRLLIGERLRWFLGDVVMPWVGTACVVLLLTPFQPAAFASRLQWLAFLAGALGLSTAASILLSSRLRPRVTTWWSRTIVQRVPPAASI
jgi:O-antigen/teichoic acid export membrane protein